MAGLKEGGQLRVSPDFFNTEEEIDYTASRVIESVQRLRETFPGVAVLGLWVDESGRVSVVDEPPREA